MKKCKCLKCGGIYDLPQPKSCPACGGLKFQSYFVKEAPSAASKPAAASPRPMPASKLAPKSAPRPVPVAASRPVSSPAAKPAGRTFKPPKAPGKSFGRRIADLGTSISSMSWRDCLKWITRTVAVLATAALFGLVYLIPTALLGGWWWGVLALVALCVAVKFRR